MLNSAADQAQNMPCATRSEIAKYFKQEIETLVSIRIGMNFIQSGIHAQ
jgi:hypothetical protein